MSSVEPRTISVRVAEWTEWIPRFPDHATEGQLAVSSGNTFFQALPAEKLVDLDGHAAPVPGVTRKARMDKETNELTMLEEDATGEDIIEIEFALWSFKALLVVTAEEGDEPPESMITSKIPQQSRIETAAALPVNMHSHGAKGQRPKRRK